MRIFRKFSRVVFVFFLAFCLFSIECWCGEMKTTVLGLTSDPGAETFAETFTTELRGAVEVRVRLGHTGKTQNLEQLTLAFGCPERPDPACLKEIGKGLETTHLIYGHVAKASKNPPYAFKVETHLFNVKAGKALKSTSLLIPPDKQGTVYIQEAADRVIGELFNEPPSTTIIIQSNVVGADIILDERLVGKTSADPIWLRDISPGKHRIIVKKEGYKIFEKKVDIKKGTRLDVDAPLFRQEEAPVKGLQPMEKKRNNWKLYTGIGATALGVGFATAGAGFGIQVLMDNKETEGVSVDEPDVDICECIDRDTCKVGGDEEKLKKICDRRRKLFVGQVAFFSAGAVVGGVGLYFLIDSLRKRKESAGTSGASAKGLSLIPSVSPFGGYLSLVGSF